MKERGAAGMAGRLIGHLIFVFLHMIAVLCGFVLLIITVPLHLIYTSQR